MLDWNVPALKTGIRECLADAENYVSIQGAVEYMLDVISSGANGVHQPKDAFEFFSLPTPDHYIGDPASYDPDTDEWAWEYIEEHTELESTAIREELEKDEALMTEIAATFEWWAVTFGHRELDGDYGLVFCGELK